jgi:hypothetical protein
MQSHDKQVKYRLKDDDIIRSGPESLTRTKAFRIHGGTVIHDVQPVKVAPVQRIEEPSFDDVAMDETVAEEAPKKMGRPRKQN